MDTIKTTTITTTTTTPTSAERAYHTQHDVARTSEEEEEVEPLMIEHEDEQTGGASFDSDLERNDDKQRKLSPKKRLAIRIPVFIRLLLIAVLTLAVFAIVSLWKVHTDIDYLPLELKGWRNKKYVPIVQTSGVVPGAFCSILRIGGGKGKKEHYPSVGSIWRNHKRDILEASKEYPKFELKNPTKDTVDAIFEGLFAALTPSRLARSIKHPPSHQVVKRIVEKMQKRFADPSSSSPPLRILVTGGSVTQGWLGDANPAGLDMNVIKREGHYFNEWAWASRLQHMTNNMLGYEAVVVENLAVGGFTSMLGARIIRYGLYSGDDAPDIIINGHASNDINSGNPHYGPWMYDGLEEYYLAARSIRGCAKQDQQPMIIYLDDYLGDMTKQAGKMMTWNQAMSKLSNWRFDVMAISYADAVRDIVYANTKESWFSPPWYDENGHPNSHAQVHHGAGGHIAMSWTIAYNLLSSFVTYCDEESQFQQQTSCDINASPVMVVEPNSIPDVPLPAMTDDLIVYNISSQWRAKEEVLEQCNTSFSNETHRHCQFAWMAQVLDGQSKDSLARKMNPIITQSDGWEASRDENNWARTGFVAVNGSKSTVVLTVPVTSSSVGIIDWVYLKSYGEQWENSTARISVTVHENATNVNNNGHLFQKGTAPSAPQVMELAGYHEFTTSQSYVEHMQLVDKATVGMQLRIEITLLAGKNFKFTGMAFCNF
eukprot:scaffold15348_cov57-Attheya_sp.AAC.1